MAVSRTSVFDAERMAITIRRVFNAPRQRVFDAMTKPEHIERWFRPPGMSVWCWASELQVGGSFRIVLQRPDGRQVRFIGVYREIMPPRRRVYTWVTEAYPTREAVVTETFDACDAWTRFTAVHAFQSCKAGAAPMAPQ
jgi:uncharacterized protein YndB with AHSA1/START domain